MPEYALGSTPPPVRADIGSGTWCSDTQSAKFLLYKRMLQAALESGGPTLTLGTDAARHMRHYLNNTGNELVLDVPALMARSSQINAQFKAELEAAKAFCQTLPPGRHEITSKRLSQGYFRQRDDTNLFFAIGGYSYWGQGRVEVIGDTDDTGAASGRPGKGAPKTAHRTEPRALEFVLDFEFHFFDRYNWDGGKQVSIAGITVTDAFMQNFHRQCYAREYDVRGSLRQRLRWSAATVH